MADFQKIVELTLKNEGGGRITDDPSDPGGLTKWGISQRAHPGLDIRSLSKADASAIYFREYYADPGIHRIDDTELAYKVFDTGVMTGPGRAIQFLQGACNVFGAGMKVDGNLGPITASFANGYRHTRALVAAFEGMAFQYFVKIGNRKYLAGWLVRLDGNS